MTHGLWWEDLTSGWSLHLGSCAVDRDEVIAFATRYDPQPFHVDEAAAAANPLFGRLCASGVHSFALTSRLMFDGFQRAGLLPLGGAGLDELRFLKPVFPGDTLTARVEVIAARMLASYPDRGVVTMRTEASNQHGEAVLRFSGAVFFPRRPDPLSRM